MQAYKLTHTTIKQRMRHHRHLVSCFNILQSYIFYTIIVKTLKSSHFRGLIIFKKIGNSVHEGLTSLAETGLNVEFLLYGILYNKDFLLIAIEIG